MNRSDRFLSWLMTFMLFVVVVGGLLVGTLLTGGAANADAGSVYNSLAAERSKSNRPGYDATLNKIAQSRAAAAAKKDQLTSAELSGAIDANMRKNGYRTGHSIGGMRSDGDDLAVADSLTNSQGSVIKNTAYNRVGVGVAHAASGTAYVIAVYADYKAPSQAQPATVPNPKPAPTKAPSSGSGTGSSGGSNGGSNSGSGSQSTPKQPTAAGVKASQEAKAKSEADAKAKAEAEKKAEAERKAQEEAEAKALEEERQAAREAQEQARMEREKAEEEAVKAQERAEAADAERQRAEAEREKTEKQAAEQRASIKVMATNGSYGLMGLGGLALLAGCMVLGRREIAVPDDIEAWAADNWDAEAGRLR